MSNFKVTGLDKLQKRLKQMERATEELGNKKCVSFDELFNSRFMNKYTQYRDFSEMLTAGGFIVESQEDFEAIPDDVFDAHVKATTDFSSWEEMLGKAGEEYVFIKLGF